MYVLSVPEITVTVPRMGRVVRPNVPAWLHNRRRGWVQASGVPIGVRRSRLVAVSVTPVELDELLTIDGVTYEGECCSLRQATDMDVALATQPPRWGEWVAKRAEIKAALRVKDTNAVSRLLREFEPISQDVVAFHRGPSQEFVSSYRGIAEACELLESKNVYALSVAASDGMSGSSASINARTMDAALGGAGHTWALDQGSFAVAAGIAASGSSGENTAHDGSQSAVDVQRSSVKSTATTGDSAMCRWADASNYALSANALNVHQVYKKVAGSFSQLGSNGGALAAGDVHSVDATGTTFSGLKSGSVDIGPVTEAALPSTGVGGIRGFDAATTLDDFVFEVGAVTAPPNVTYPTPVTFTVNVAISTQSPTLASGDAATSYAEDPGAPNTLAQLGLVLDAGTGAITGTATPIGDYTVGVIASNAGGAGTPAAMTYHVVAAPIGGGQSAIPASSVAKSAFADSAIAPSSFSSEE